MRISITPTSAGLRVHLQGERWRFDLALDALKREIPHQFRKFNPERRGWFIDHCCQVELERWARRMRFGVEAEIVYEDKSHGAKCASRHPLTDAYLTLRLLPMGMPDSYPV